MTDGAAPCNVWVPTEKALLAYPTTTSTLHDKGISGHRQEASPFGKGVARALEFDSMPGLPKCSLFSCIGSAPRKKPNCFDILHSGLTHSSFGPCSLLLFSWRRSPRPTIALLGAALSTLSVQCVPRSIPGRLNPGKSLCLVARTGMSS